MSAPSTPETWPAQWLRGVLDLAVLAVIARGETYGYRIGADLAALGLGAVKGGTLYPLLARLEETGAVETTWREGDAGPGRKWYSATAEGRERLEREGARWRAFARLTGDLMPGGDGPGAGGAGETAVGTAADRAGAR